MKRTKNIILRKFENKKKENPSHRLKYLDLEKLKNDSGNSVVLEKIKNNKRGIKSEKNTFISNDLNIRKNIYKILIKEHLKDSKDNLENGEFEDLICEMLLPLGFVENLENLKENSSSIIYLLKIKDLCEEVLKKNEMAKKIILEMSKLGNLQQ